MKLKSLLISLGLLAWLTISFFLSFLIIRAVIQFSSTQNLSSAVLSVLIFAVLFAAITTLPIYLAISYFRVGNLYVRVVVSVLIVLFLTIFFAARNGIFTLRFFQNYPGTRGTYSAEFVGGLASVVYPRFTFVTKDSPEQIIEFYQPLLNKKGLRIHKSGGYVLVSQGKHQYVGDENLLGYLEEVKSSQDSPSYLLSVSCNSNDKKISNLRITESSSGEANVTFRVVQGGSLLSPLTPCY